MDLPELQHTQQGRREDLRELRCATTGECAVRTSIRKNFVKDEESIKAAKAAPDIHCGFCGTRNPATAETCSQCGGNLKEGLARQAGRVMQTPLTARGPENYQVR